MTMMTVVREAKGPAEALFVLANTADREMVSFSAHSAPRMDAKARPLPGFRAQ